MSPVSSHNSEEHIDWCRIHRSWPSNNIEILCKTCSSTVDQNYLTHLTKDLVAVPVPHLTSLAAVVDHEAPGALLGDLPWP